MSKADLKLDWCTHEAAKYACEKWHYSRKLPMGKLVRIGAWESGQFIGCVVLSPGANCNLLKPYGLTQFDGCELIRIALAPWHKTEVSRICRIAIKMLVKSCPKIRMIVSFADPAQRHHGGIYQAMGWVYAGMTAGDTEFYIDGKWRKQRVFRSSEWSKYSGMDHKSLPCRNTDPKHRYLMPLDSEMRAKVLPLSKPYPKRVRSVDSDASTVQVGEGGATPTRTLLSEAHHGT